MTSGNTRGRRAGCAAPRAFRCRRPALRRVSSSRRPTPCWPKTMDMKSSAPGAISTSASRNRLRTYVYQYDVDPANYQERTHPAHADRPADALKRRICVGTDAVSGLAHGPGCTDLPAVQDAGAAQGHDINRRKGKASQLIAPAAPEWRRGCAPSARAAFRLSPPAGRGHCCRAIFPSTESATRTVPSCTSGVISPIE